MAEWLAAFVLEHLPIKEKIDQLKTKYNDSNFTKMQLLFFVVHCIQPHEYIITKFSTTYSLTYFYWKKIHTITVVWDNIMK